MSVSAVERGERLRFERQQRELIRRRAKFLADAAVVVEQRAVVENQILADDALERHRLLEELTARAPGLRRLLHGFASLRLQLIERQDQLAQRVDERQASPAGSPEG